MIADFEIIFDHVVRDIYGGFEHTVPKGVTD